MKSGFFVSAIVITAAFLQGCSQFTDPVKKDYSDQIIPLAVGNKWEYHNTLYDTAGNVSTNIYTTNIITGDTVLEANRWFYTDRNALYYSVLPDGYYTYNQYESDSLKNSLVYKYPCHAEDKYSDYSVIKLDTMIIVPAGSFKCIMYSLRKKTSMEFACADYFIKPGVGVVKTVEYSFTDTHPLFLYRTQELLNYQFQQE